MLIISIVEPSWFEPHKLYFHLDHKVVFSLYGLYTWKALGVWWFSNTLLHGIRDLGLGLGPVPPHPKLSAIHPKPRSHLQSPLTTRPPRCCAAHSLVLEYKWIAHFSPLA